MAWTGALFHLWQMQKRRHIFPALLILFVTSVSSLTAAGGKPNIIYILADDLGYGDVQCLNPQGKIPTPHLDRLAQEGMTFTDAHANSSVCTPTRYGVLTGRYNWRSRLSKGVLGGNSPHLIEDGRMTAASFLKAQGYDTACIGKWHLGMDLPKSGKGIDWRNPIAHGPTSVGFDYYYGISASLDMPPYVYIENDRFTQVPTKTTQEVPDPAFHRAGPIADDFSFEEVLPRLTDKAVSYIREQAKAEKPFFLFYPMTGPHTPIVPTKEFRGKTTLGDYGDFCVEVDAMAGRVFAAVKAAGIAENTLIIFTSDNGCSRSADFAHLESLGHHPSAQFRGMKADIFDGGHRVPFLVSWPGKIVGGKTSDETICLVDFMATCADLLGQRLPDTAGEDSVSLLPVLLGKPQARPLHEAVIHHSLEGNFAVRQGKWKLELCPGSGGWSDPKPGSPDENTLPPIQLYDLSQDIGERTNVQAKHPKIVARLTKLLGKYVEEGRSTPGQPQPNHGPVDIFKNPRVKEEADKVMAKPAAMNSTAKNTAAVDRGAQAEKGDRMFVYKTAGDQKLRLWVRMPKDAKPGDQRPAAVFFHGGGWVGGPLFQFKDHCSYLASRGMVGIQVEYRFVPNGDDGGPPLVCVQDAKSAMRWVRAHAAELGIDPNRIAAGGGSAGGHLAAFASMVEGCDDPQDDLTISPRGNAQLLFNPVFDNGPGGYGHVRMGQEWKRFSPAHHITADDPPAIVFLGTKDDLIPVRTLESFAANMEKVGVRCETHYYEGRAHGFFNAPADKKETIAKCDAFLVSLGWIGLDGKIDQSKTNAPVNEKQTLLK
jgi:arylsulfatase A-like enzyme/acetyl esterase/lipase